MAYKYQQVKKYVEKDGTTELLEETYPGVKIPMLMIMDIHYYQHHIHLPLINLKLFALMAIFFINRLLSSNIL